MEVALAALALLTVASTGADDPAHADNADDARTVSSHLEPLAQPQAAQIPDFGEVDAERCAIVVERARAGSGQPLLRRDPAATAPPLLSAAIDRRIGKCPVIQMLGNRDDVRPFPEREDGAMFELIPAAE